MRQLVVQIPREHGQAAIAAARAASAVNVARWAASGEDEDIDLVLLHVDNAAVEPLLARLSDLPGARASFLPSGVVALYPPRSESPEQVREVELRTAEPPWRGARASSPHGRDQSSRPTCGSSPPTSWSMSDAASGGHAPVTSSSDHASPARTSTCGPERASRSTSAAASPGGVDPGPWLGVGRMTGGDPGASLDGGGGTGGDPGP